MPAPIVELLRCPACGAAVPLGQTDEARCGHCGTSVPLPEASRELRRLQGQDEAARQRAQALFSTLDSPPWLLTRVVAATFDQPMFGFWLVFGVPVGLVAIFGGIALGARLHLNPPATTGVSFALIFLLTFLPRSIGIYANRRAGGRRVLVAGLAAKPPKHPGGPAGCRECGAPLEVAAGAMVVRCVYCGSDCAVEVRTPLLVRTRRAARAIAHTIDEAVAIDRDERAATRHTLYRELRRYLLTTSIFGGLFAIWMWDYDRVTLADDGSAPAYGIAALVVGTLLLIVLMMRGGANADSKEESALRRSDNGVPGWVSTAGPIAFWAILWLLRAAIWR